MNVTILGCGAYGIALASVFLENDNNKICVWNKFENEILSLDKNTYQLILLQI